MKYRCRWAQMGLDSQSVNIKKNPEIDFSLWLQFLFVFFSHYFQCAWVISQPTLLGSLVEERPPSKLFSQNLPLKDLHGTQPQLSLSLCDNIDWLWSPPADRFMATNGANKDDAFLRWGTMNFRNIIANPAPRLETRASVTLTKQESNN